MVPDRRRRHPVTLDQLQRLRVLARRDLHLVAAREQQLDQRPEDERMRARGHVDPDAHGPTLAADEVGAAATLRTHAGDDRSPLSLRDGRPRCIGVRSPSADTGAVRAALAAECATIDRKTARLPGISELGD